MEKRSLLETATIIAAIFMAAWAVRGEIATNTAAIAELRGLLMSHIGGHYHAPVVAESESDK